MPNQMAMKFLGNSKILPFLGIKSEFNHSGRKDHGGQVTQNDGNSREKRVFPTGIKHIVGHKCGHLWAFCGHFAKFYIQFCFIQSDNVLQKFC